MTYQGDVELKYNLYYVEAEYEPKFEDTSFDHEFGTEKRGYWYAGDIVVTHVEVYDQEGECHEIHEPSKELIEAIAEYLQENINID